MSTRVGATEPAVEAVEADLWRALASPWRRRLLDLLRDQPRSTGELAAGIPELSRYAVMQHLEVLVDAGVVLARRRGRLRLNYLNPVPLRRWYERWVQPLAGATAADLLALQRAVEGTGDKTMTSATATVQIRSVRLECELRFRATAQRVFEVLTTETRSWFPHTFGGDRVRAIVIEPRVGGLHYEDWGDGAGHLYGHVTVFDPPHRYATRGRIMAGSILDTEYEISEVDDEAVLRVSKVAVGPMTDEEAGSIRRFGDLTLFGDALRAVIEGVAPAGQR